jgi:D-alanyl-D-alanine carboxypeptidase (penicillin-binding protein 5/6)
LVALVLGAVIALALIVGIQLPLLHPWATTKVHAVALHPSGPVNPIVWPSVGSAALVIPALGVERSWHNTVQPIASLTKLMTAYVVLKRLPLAPGETGPCLTITPADVTSYDELKVTDQSSVAVASGESICEIDLLNGLLVHSASNYAVLLATMVAGNVTSFVALMNETAQHLGLRGTHYADVSGFSNQSVSTALDQGRLAALLMKSPLVRNIVDQTSVVLPVAGTVYSFTPDVGIDNVIGVKSGRTAAAGGCDVMAMTFANGTTTDVAYAVVLGQQGGDLLGPAGEAALALDQSATTQEHASLAKGAVVGRIGWGRHRANIVLAHSATFSWWGAKGSLTAQIHVDRFSSDLRKGQVVGYVSVGVEQKRRISLVTGGAVAPPSLWQRLL